MAEHRQLHVVMKLLLRVGCVLAFSGIVAAVVLQGQLSLSNEKEAKLARLGPTTDYNSSLPTDPQKQAKRQVRSKKYDKSEWRINPNDVADSTVRVDYFDPNFPDVPVEQSDAVIVGEILNAHAYLSNDKTGVYSEFSVKVHEIVKSDGTITPAGLIDVEREGGRVRFPSGKVHSYSIDKANMPQVGSHYILFLKRQTEEQPYHLLTGYELRGDRVYPLDELNQFKVHKGAEKGPLLSKINSILAPLP